MTRLMHPRLETLRHILGNMGRRVDDILSDALITLTDVEWNLGESAERRDKEIRRESRELLQVAEGTLLLHQPVARDFRFLISVMTIAAYLEHMGDCANHICQRAGAITPPTDSLHDLSNLARQRSSQSLRLVRHLEQRKSKPWQGMLDLAKELSRSRGETEAVLEAVLQDLEVAARLPAPARGPSIPVVLIASELRQICDYAASIADQVLFLELGVKSLRRPKAA